MQRQIAAVVFLAVLAGWFYGPEVGLSVVIAFAALVGASIAYRNSEEFMRFESRALDSADTERMNDRDYTDATFVDVINGSRFPIRIVDVTYLRVEYNIDPFNFSPMHSFLKQGEKPTYKSPAVERIPYEGILLEPGARLSVALLPEQEPKPPAYARRPTHIRVSTTTRTYTSPIRSRVPSRCMEIRLRLLWRWKMRNGEGIRAQILKWLVWEPYGCLTPRRWRQPQWEQRNQRDKESMANRDKGQAT